MAPKMVPGARTLVGRSPPDWAGQYQGEDPHHASEVTISRTNTSIFIPGIVEAMVSMAGSSAVVCAVVLANK